ncbi:MAG: ABC transporter ATP-binding protein [Acetobacteraceae bacterium]|nr:ABC transporter ATP-binding protein [Acetobacteraceae bacterium]
MSAVSAAPLRPISASAPRAQNLLQVEHLQATAARIPVVDRVSLAIAPGRTLCLVGESGSGKSVTARALLRLLEPPLRIEAGTRIVLDGRDLMTLDDRAMREIRGGRVGMVFQEPGSALDPLYTVGSQLAEVMRQHLRLSRSAAMARALDLLRRVGIPAPERRLHQFPHELSGGMQQRVGIALALACDPVLLIADEPTTALDVTVQAQILALIREQQRSRNMALLLITHDLGVAAEMADEVAVMYAGRIVEHGSAPSILQRPQHPYTAALLRSIPRPGMRRQRKLTAIAGLVPPPSEWGDACRFAPRCPHAMPICGERAPVLLPTGDGAAACWLHAA